MDDTWMKPVVRERRHLTQSPIVDVDIHLIVGYGASDLKPSSVPVATDDPAFAVDTTSKYPTDSGTPVLFLQMMRHIAQ